MRTNNLFMNNHREAKRTAQKLMDPYGLKIDMACSGWEYTNSEYTEGILTVHTTWQPVKGNKALMEKLKADGYNVETISKKDYETGTRSQLFLVRIGLRYRVGEG